MLALMIVALFESIPHVFIKCLEILSLWNKLSMHIYCKTTNRIGFNITNVIVGEIPLNQGNKVVNFIILYSKQYIFNCLKQKRSLTERDYYNISISNIRLKDTY